MGGTANRQATGILSVVAIMLLAAAGVVGWRWMMNVPLDAIAVDGNEISQTEEILNLADIDTSATLFRIDTNLVQDRIERHPWVRDASILRLPTGTMHIGITEREPVVQVLGAAGRIAFYLDMTGAMIPVVDSSSPDPASSDPTPIDSTLPEPAPPPAGFDLPVLSGLEADYHPMGRVRSGTLLTFLRQLSTLPPEKHRLVSEVILTGRPPEQQINLQLAPAAGQPSITVRFGSDDFDTRFAALTAFWDQQVRRHPDIRYDVVDLRFDSQIITREAALTPGGHP